MFKKHLTFNKVGFSCWVMTALIPTGSILAQGSTAPTPVVAPRPAQNEEFKSELDLIFKAFKTRQYDLIKPLLDSQVKIGNLPQGNNDVIMPQLLAQLEIPSSYLTSEVTKEGQSTRVDALYTYPGGKSVKQSFVFNAERKITSLGLPENTEVQVASIQMDGGTRETPDKIEVPFELYDNLIWIKAELNGKQGTFIFDSGTPALLVNADLFNPEQFIGSFISEGVVGGKITNKISHVDTFNWSGLKISDLNSAALPMNHLKNKKHKVVLGYIGYDIFKDYEVTFDYGRKRLTLVRTDKFGEPVIARVVPVGKVSVVPFEMHGHIPVFPMKTGGKTYSMGLDSGAGGNLLHIKHWLDVQPNISNVGSTALFGFGKEQSTAKTADLRGISIGDVQYTMAFLFESSNLDKLDLSYDGLLGYEFLRQHVTSINYKKGELRIYKGTVKR